MKRRGVVLPPVRPSAAIARNYQSAIDRLIREMNADTRRALQEDYDAAEFAKDATPVNALVERMRALRRKWLARFDALAPELSRLFAAAAATRSDVQLRNALRRAGFTVRLQLSEGQANILQATVHENVSLIRSIPEQYMTDVEGMVMRSVVNGRDLATLTDGLSKRYGITRRRAATIARDQNNKVTGALQAQRQAELGLKAIWMHSAGGKTPRPSHVANNGKEYDPAVGWYDPDVGEHIWPGTLINCRCVSRAVVFPG